MARFPDSQVPPFPGRQVKAALRSKLGCILSDNQWIGDGFDIVAVEDKLNSRHRKLLSYQTPSEVFLMITISARCL